MLFYNSLLYNLNIQGEYLVKDVTCISDIKIMED